MGGVKFFGFFSRKYFGKISKKTEKHSSLRSILTKSTTLTGILLPAHLRSTTGQNVLPHKAKRQRYPYHRGIMLHTMLLYLSRKRAPDTPPLTCYRNNLDHDLRNIFLESSGSDLASVVGAGAPAGHPTRRLIPAHLAPMLLCGAPPAKRTLTASNIDPVPHTFSYAVQRPCGHHPPRPTPPHKPSPPAEPSPATSTPVEERVLNIRTVFFQGVSTSTPFHHHVPRPPPSPPLG